MLPVTAWGRVTLADAWHVWTEGHLLPRHEDNTVRTANIDPGHLVLIIAGCGGHKYLVDAESTPPLNINQAITFYIGIDFKHPFASTVSVSPSLHLL